MRPPPPRILDFPSPLRPTQTFPLIAAVGPWSDYFCSVTRASRIWLAVGCYLVVLLTLPPAIYVRLAADTPYLAVFPATYHLATSLLPTINLLALIDGCPPQVIDHHRAPKPNPNPNPDPDPNPTQFVATVSVTVKVGVGVR